MQQEGDGYSPYRRYCLNAISQLLKFQRRAHNILPVSSHGHHNNGFFAALFAVLVTFITSFQLDANRGVRFPDKTSLKKYVPQLLDINTISNAADVYRVWKIYNILLTIYHENYSRDYSDSRLINDLSKFYKQLPNLRYSNQISYSESNFLTLRQLKKLLLRQNHMCYFYQRIY